MKPESYPSDLNECDAVIHTVGALLEGVDYKAAFTGNPLSSLRQCAISNLATSVTGGQRGPYDETLEAKNRDACKLLAEHYNLYQKTSGHFVFLSAAPSIAPLLRQYIEMKEQAEGFLLHNCPNLTPVILKPGLVWHESERSWSIPFKLASDFGWHLNRHFI